MAEIIKCWFDGACAPINPKGHLGIGCYIKENEKIIFEYAGYVEASNETSNNVAEYLAFENVIDWLLENGCQDDDITIFGDSKLVVNQMNKWWRIKEGVYVEHAARCIEKIDDFSNLKIRWISRDYNDYADNLSNEQLRKKGIKKFDPTKNYKTTNL